MNCGGTIGPMISATGIAVANTRTESPNARVTIYLDGKQAFFVVADAQGRWSTTVPANTLGEGNHVVSAEALDPAGNQGTRATDVPFFVRIPSVRYAGQGLISCSSVSVDAAPLVLALLVLVTRRRARQSHQP